MTVAILITEDELRFASMALDYQGRYREALARSRLGLRLARTAGKQAEPLLAEALNAAAR